MSVFIWFFFFPRWADFVGCGSGRDEEPSGGKVLRLIQIRLATLSLRKIVRLSRKIRCNHPTPLFQFDKRSQPFARSHNEAPIVVAMRVSNEDCSPARIHA
jgi:hypothetical protein